MTALVHIWHEGGGTATVQLCLLVLATGTLGVLHVWLLRVFKAENPADGGVRTTQRDAIAEVRARRRRRRLAARAGVEDGRGRG